MRAGVVVAGVLGTGTALVFALAAVAATLVPNGTLVGSAWNGGCFDCGWGKGGVAIPMPAPMPMPMPMPMPDDGGWVENGIVVSEPRILVDDDGESIELDAGAAAQP